MPMFKSKIIHFQKNCERIQKLNHETHLFYIDDLIFYTNSEDDLQSVIKITVTYSAEIKMKFGNVWSRVLDTNLNIFSIHA